MEHNWKQPSQTQNTEVKHIPQDAIHGWPMLVFSRGWVLYSDLTWDLTACRLPPVDVTNWEASSRYRGASLSCRSQLHDRRSRSPGMGIQSIAGSNARSHRRHGALSSALDRCEAPEMGPSAPAKLRLGPTWICRIGKLQGTRYWLEI